MKVFFGISIQRGSHRFARSIVTQVFHENVSHNLTIKFNNIPILFVKYELSIVSKMKKSVVWLRKFLFFLRNFFAILSHILISTHKIFSLRWFRQNYLFNRCLQVSKDSDLNITTTTVGFTNYQLENINSFFAPLSSTTNLFQNRKQNLFSAVEDLKAPILSKNLHNIVNKAKQDSMKFIYFQTDSPFYILKVSDANKSWEKGVIW